MQLRTQTLSALVLAAGLAAPTNLAAQQRSATEPLIIEEQGSFAAGGTIRTEPGTFDPLNPTDPAGQTYRGDHLYAFYQIPADARELPIVMWHGFGQFSKTWESTPDGREGFQSIFLRRGFPVYLIDQPRRGNAGKGMIGTTIEPTANEQFWFGQFRIGVWPDYFDGVQFSSDPEVLDQYFRQITPDTGPIDIDVNADAVSALFDRKDRASSSPTPTAAAWDGKP